MAPAAPAGASGPRCFSRLTPAGNLSPASKRPLQVTQAVKHISHTFLQDPDARVVECFGRFALSIIRYCPSSDTPKLLSQFHVFFVAGQFYQFLEKQAAAGLATKSTAGMTPAQALAHSQAQGDSGSAWECVLRRVCAAAAGAYDSRTRSPRDRPAPLVIRRKPPQNPDEASLGGGNGSSAAGSSGAADARGDVTKSGGELFELLGLRNLQTSVSGDVVVSEWSLFATFISQSLRQVEDLIAGLFGRSSSGSGTPTRWGSNGDNGGCGDDCNDADDDESLDILDALGRIDVAALSRLCVLTSGEVNIILQV